MVRPKLTTRERKAFHLFLRAHRRRIDRELEQEREANQRLKFILETERRDQQKTRSAAA